MANSNHKPGPWEYMFVEKAMEPHTIMGPASGDGSRTSIAHTPWDRPFEAANFRLMAASPELLSVCEKLLQHVTDGTIMCGIVAGMNLDKTKDEARAAIAKAKGGA